MRSKWASGADRRDPLRACESGGEVRARAKPVVEETRGVARKLPRSRRRNNERNRRQSMSDVPNPDKAVALDVHFGDIGDAADVLVVRDQRQAARPTRHA